MVFQMINVDNKVKNIYYMLCYSFIGERLNEKEEAQLSDEAFSNIYNLFSLLLCLILKKQVKKGLYKEYIYTTDEIRTIKGKINISETINNNSLRKKKITCDLDEYSENCLLNKVIKTTLLYLLKSNKIGIQTKDSLKKLLNYYSNVDTIEINLIKWDRIQYNRNNLTYKYVIDLCRLILNELVVSDKNGKNKFKEFLDDSAISSIYEKFVRAYFRKHFPEFNASSKRIYITNENIPYIPTMKTDINLEYKGRKLIIDTKFYNQILKENSYGCKTLSNAHLNQIYVYVDSYDPLKEGNVSGMLLYAQTVHEPLVSVDFKMNNHNIHIRTLDMNKDWNDIKESLNNIGNNFKNNKF